MKLLPALLAIPVCTALVVPISHGQAALREKPVSDDPLRHVIDESELLSFHRSLVSIPSVSADEGAIAEYVASFLEHQNFTVIRQLVKGSSKQEPPRFNVYAYLGDNEHPEILVTSHIDTVPPFLPYRLTYDPDARGFDRSRVLINGRGKCAPDSITDRTLSSRIMRRLMLLILLKAPLTIRQALPRKFSPSSTVSAMTRPRLLDCCSKLARNAMGMA